MNILVLNRRSFHRPNLLEVRRHSQAECHRVNHLVCQVPSLVGSLLEFHRELQALNPQDSLLFNPLVRHQLSQAQLLPHCRQRNHQVSHLEYRRHILRLNQLLVRQRDRVDSQVDNPLASQAESHLLSPY